MKKKFFPDQAFLIFVGEKNTSIYSIVQVGNLGVILAASLYSTHYASSNESHQLFL